MKFSVLLSVYEKEKSHYLEKALESLVAQTLPPDEVVLVQDGAITEGLEAVIATYQHSLPIKQIKLKENQGLSKALNAGLQHCKNEWVARMDTDDIALPERLAVQAETIRNNPELDIVGSWATTIDEKGTKKTLLKVPLSDARIKKLVWSCPMIHPTVCFKKEKIVEAGGYNPGAGPRQDDYDLWYRCASAGLVFGNIPRSLLLYRFTDENIRKNSLKVGCHRAKTGFRGNRALGYGPLAYVGVTIPLFRALLPYPLNVWFYKLTHRFNPRAKATPPIKK